MSTTDETEAQGDAGAAGLPPRRQPGWVKPAKRYGPILVVLALIGAAVVVFGGGDDNDSDDRTATDGATASEEELIASGPMTWQKAEQEGETAGIDWGPNCDTETGRIRLLSVYAPPCVQPFKGDNGGATSPGVTADTVKVVQYIADPALDPLAAAMFSDAGADVSPKTAAETVQGFADLYNKLYETYGRTVEVETYVGTGASDDREAAKADAIAIAEMDPFMVVGGPSQSSAVFAPELAGRSARLRCPTRSSRSTPRTRFWEEGRPSRLLRWQPRSSASWLAPARPSLRGTTPPGPRIASMGCCTTTRPMATTGPRSRRSLSSWATTASSWQLTSSSRSTCRAPRRTRAPTSVG
jgi:hypothetical protein